MQKEIIDRIWQEELKRFGLEGENIYWRHGYPFVDGFFVAKSYVDTFPDGSKRVTLDETIKKPFNFRKDIRHEFYHVFCEKHKLGHSEADSIFCEFFPSLQLKYCKWLLKRNKK